MDQSRTLQARQIKRDTLWASQWLEMLLLCMPIIDKAPLPKAARVWLDKKLRLLASFVAHAVFIRAALLQRSESKSAAQIRNHASIRRANARLEKAHYHGQKRSGLSIRATLGGALRRAARARGSLQRRAESILRALRSQDKLLARFVRRMRKGLSRRTSLHTRASETLALQRPAAGGAPHTARGEELRVARAPP